VFPVGENSGNKSGNTAKLGGFRPPLPPALWRTGIATFAEAWYIWQELKGQYVVALGRNAVGYYVTSPDHDAEGSSP
jgi:hypothetical protein